MAPFLGIVIEQSLGDPAFAETLDVVRRRRDPRGSWVFLLVRIERERLDSELERIRHALATDRAWYTHFFSESDIAVVFPDTIIHMTTDPDSWAPAIERGLELGIPIEQLDFDPHTVEQAERSFGLTSGELG